jgi:hypothetical protein
MNSRPYRSSEHLGSVYARVRKLIFAVFKTALTQSEAGSPTSLYTSILKVNQSTFVRSVG